MPSIDTATLVEGQVHAENLQIYCGLDSMVTYEVHGVLRSMRSTPNPIYDFERALQGPALEMMLRGWRIDEIERRKACDVLRADIALLQGRLDAAAHVVWGRGLNPNSQKQLLSFFYDSMHLPPQATYKRGERKLSMNRDTLEKLSIYFHAMPLIHVILKIRELSKQLSVLETEVDNDNRLRQSYNIAGTETGRPSSSENAFGTGTNIQNIDRRLRKVFVADPGWKLLAIDFEQSEARDIGWLCWVIFGDSTYLDHCESYDLHTATARLVWPTLKWSKDRAENRRIAEQPYYRHFTYRDMAKRGGHAGNYMVSAPTLAHHLKIEVKMADEFLKRYFSAYACITRLHRWVAEQIQTTHLLVSSFGRQRHFFGRPNDEATLREAVAYCGQSPTADRTSLAMWRIWYEMRHVQLLHEVYDAIYVQYRAEDEGKVVAQATELTKVALEHKGRRFIVPVDVKVGWNWGDYDEQSNLDGLKKWKGLDSRKRHVGLERIL